MKLNDIFTPKNTIAAEVYLENRTSRELVGTLYVKIDQKKGKKFYFEYTDKYLNNPKSIPLGPDIPLTKKIHISRKLFRTLDDRIPSRNNPAYGEYCVKQGIDINESNPLILLTTIGKRGPSSFIFEPVYKEQLTGPKVKKFREYFELSIREFSALLGFSPSSISNLEKEKIKGEEILRRIELYFFFPETFIYEVKKNGKMISDKKRQKILEKIKAFAPTEIS